MKRGDVIMSAIGKPRPSIIVQANRIKTPTELLLCPLTSYLVEVPLYRPRLEPDACNGLKKTSQFMVDKAGPVRRDWLGEVIGTLAADDLRRLDVALAVVFGLR